MIFVKTKLFITDNSGGKLAECIKVLGSKYGSAFLSDLIIFSIKKAVAKKKVRVHDVRMGIVVRMARRTLRNNGITISFVDNAVIVLDKRDEPQGNRIFGPIASELVTSKYNKVIFMAPSVI
ncbi:MAG: ribosomal protein [Haloplasmataceae bacterium]|jgi:large subunit ribosomal protein L14|nr:ribosomal protein [Haloplasmataceae bacterium]